MQHESTRILAQRFSDQSIAAVIRLLWDPMVVGSCDKRSYLGALPLQLGLLRRLSVHG